jgi:hypothetical protein
MMATFDPVGERKAWLNFILRAETKFEPDRLAPRVRPDYVATCANSFIEAYLIGLANEVRPTLEQIITWMESQPEPDQSLFSKEYDHWSDKWFTLYSWRQTLGLCKWLSRGETAEKEFRRALEIERECWKHAPADSATADHKERQDFLTEHLAMALAANIPAIGLELHEATGVRRPSWHQKLLFDFGLWACQHLARGGTRDADFVARGEKMLRGTLLPHFFWEADRTEPGLWLKAIYWDSGVAKTPEAAIARAYDSMPGVERPDFVPR